MNINAQITRMPILVALALALGACGEDPEELPPDGGDAPASWECDSSHDGWKRCDGGKIKYCHVVAGMDPHFHWGTDCAARALECVEIGDEGAAACVDSETPCSAQDVRCDQNTAYFCVDGNLAQEPCGTASTCEMVDGLPGCVEKSGECGGHGHLVSGACVCDDGYVPDPSDSTACVPAEDLAKLACDSFAASPDPETAVSDFASFEDAHMDLDHAYAVQLPDGVPGYVHFPVKATGEYVIFLSDAGRFDAFMHRDGTEVSPAATGGVAASSCASVVGDHWHVALTFDAEAGANGPVPYIVRFKPVPGGATVKAMIRVKGE